MQLSVKFTIAYDGTETSPAVVAQQWRDVVGQNVGWVTLHDNSLENDSSLTADQKTRYNALKDQATTNTAPYGLKFAAADNDFDNSGDLDVKGNAVVNNAALLALDFDSNGVEEGGTLVSEEISGAATIYVGVWGIDNIQQEESDAYEIKVTPKLAANS